MVLSMKQALSTMFLMDNHYYDHRNKKNTYNNFVI